MPETVKFDLTDGQVLFWYDPETKLNYAMQAQLDTEVSDPLEDDPENPVVLACWHNRHSLGTPNVTKGVTPAEFWLNLVREHMTANELFESLTGNKLHEFTANVNADDKNLIDVKVERENKSCSHIGIQVETLLDQIEDDLTVPNCQTLLYDRLVSLPLWLYEHSGMTISCGDRTYPYNDQFDSSCLGWAYCTKENLRRIDPNRNMNNWQADAFQAIRGTVELYDQYLTGDVWWYKLEKSETPFLMATSEDWEEIESVGGFFGSDMFANGMAESIPGLTEAIQNNTYKTGKVKTTYIPVTEYTVDWQ